MALVLSVVVVTPSTAQESYKLIPPRPNFLTANVEIISQHGPRHLFTVELARTLHQQRYGLMYVKSLAADRGMLFEHKPPRSALMWMKNTYVALDMLFADNRGRVVHIHENAVPLSQKLIRTPMAVRYILEVPAGTVKRLSLGVGDRMAF
ncbi:DUF192 domain-containing protein [Magnetovibrio sp. PR-2]|uniref:DUF192 domain-containing protein n=1 Tax=Magnetovibrio sp. PR-2 TaxID=3120356 RepID=UPI002FCE2EA3